jgi:hypothetical protein
MSFGAAEKVLPGGIDTSYLPVIPPDFNFQG